LLRGDETLRSIPLGYSVPVQASRAPGGITLNANAGETRIAESQTLAALGTAAQRVGRRRDARRSLGPPHPL